MKIFEQWAWRVAILFLVVFGLQGCASRGEERTVGDAKRGDLVLTSLAQIGTPYVYGGEHPSEGFDCSGLTHYVHRRAGVSIPRTALDQHRASKPVRKGQPKAGDMVFFRTSPGVYHVGLMIDDGRFVHASTSRRKVQIARLQTPYWQARYMGAGTYLE